MTNIPVSLQLYTVRDDIANDLPATFEKIAKIGYKNVEGGGFNGLTPAEYGALLSKNGLKMPGAHIGIEALLGDKFDETIADYKGLGVETIIIPFINQEWRQEGAGYGKVADALNEIGPKVKEAGLKFAYHNHNFEFEDKHEGKSGMDILLAETDPSTVNFELDTYWALKAGVDPVGFINQNADRIILLHLKDMDPEDKSFAPVGTGILPLDAILKAAPSHVGYLIVEQDVCTKQTPLESIEISYNTLKSKGYA
jgi:sugar phosphate isomerase/epimerase